MSVHDDRATICAAIKSGRASCPAGESLTTIRQRWTTQQCTDYMIENRLSTTDEKQIEFFEVTTPKITYEQKTMVSINDKGAGEMLAQAVRMLAIGSIDADEVRRIVREETAGQVRRVEVVINDCAPVDVGVTHDNFSKLLHVVGAGVRNVMLVGPSGSGKTHAAHQLAQSLGVLYYSHGSCILPSDLLGFVDAGGKYHCTQFIQAYENGGLVILDEIDSYSERASLALTEALSNGSMVAGGRRISRHKDCTVLAGANTWGTGATLEFTGRARMDSALLGRFPVKISWQYDNACESALSGNNEIAKQVQQYREKAQTMGLKIQITPRHTIAAAQLVASGMSQSNAFDLTIFAGLTPDQVRSMKG